MGMREWCTKVPNKQEQTFEVECMKICKYLGQLLCGSVPEKIGPTNDCKGTEEQCQCCCKPSCDETRRTYCTPATEPSVTTNTTEDCETDGIARGYDNYEDVVSVEKPGAGTGMRSLNWKQNPHREDSEELSAETTTEEGKDGYIDYSYEEEENHTSKP